MESVTYHVGIDTGGTFTDFVAAPVVGGEPVVLKVPSVPADPAQAVADGLDRLEAEHGIPASAIAHLIFGTTVATNAVLEHDGARVVLIATEGTRDVLEIQRSWRQRLFDLALQPPPPLARRRDRHEVRERVGSRGETVVALTGDEIDRVAGIVADSGCDAAAVCLLFSFLAPAHERAIGEAVAARAPGVHVSLSSEVCPEFREYERTSTTAMNAFVAPRLARLIDRLGEVLSARGLAAPLGILQSNGGVMRAAMALRFPVNTLLSGPAGGVVGASAAALHAGVDDVITMDMGGTSLDVCLVRGAEPELSSESVIGGYPVKVPQVNVHTIGAGGGSIARVEAGVLKVGPRSAGAVPGPACYGRGGTRATSTDAAVVLGYVVPDRFAGGTMRLDADAARAAIMADVGEPLGRDAHRAAFAVVQVQVAEMVAGIRAVSVEKGLDPREFALLPFGGAGGLYAGLVAEELGIGRLFVPVHPGVLSAKGMLLTDAKHTAVRTRIESTGDRRAAEVDAVFDELAAPLHAELADEGFAAADIAVERSCDMRYRGQAYEVNVVLPAEPCDGPGLAARFHEAHAARYGRSAPEEPVEIVNYRVVVAGRLPRIEPREIDDGAGTVPAPVHTHPAYFGERHGALECPVYERESLRAGQSIAGPALVIEAGAATVLHPGNEAIVDAWGNLVVTVPLRGSNR